MKYCKISCPVEKSGRTNVTLPPQKKTPNLQNCAICHDLFLKEPALQISLQVFVCFDGMVGVMAEMGYEARMGENLGVKLK